MKFLQAAQDGPPRTPAELAREKRLRDDPLAVVHGPLFVSCKRCGNRIKLSPKSSYDPFHWMKHRERCLRKPIGSARATRRSPKGIAHTSLAKKSPASSSNGDNMTPPPLTPDDDRPASAGSFGARSPSPNIDDLDLPNAHGHDPHRSYRFPSKHLFPLVDRWQTWNWSELRPPTWIADQDRKLSFVPADMEDWDDACDDALAAHRPPRSATRLSA